MAGAGLKECQDTIAAGNCQVLASRRACALLAGPVGPVGFQNSATDLDQGVYAAGSYSLMRPPRTARRLIRSWVRSAAG
jgi:hypothetical protein